MIKFKEFNNCITKINQWYKKKSKILTVTTSPYNTTLMYSKIIEDVVGQGGKVLYIWGNEVDNKELINNIKNTNDKISHGFIKKGEVDLNITFTSFKNIINVRGNYELCIIDDISTLSLMSKDDLIELVEGLYLYNKRIIIYSIEKIVSMGEKLEISSVVAVRPSVEPRIINTRINLEEDMPYALYDYLKWFKENKRTVIIYVPSQDKIKKVHDYYNAVFNTDKVKILTLKREESFKKIEKFINIRDRATFIITNCYDEYIHSIVNLDIVMLFAEDRFYSYKKILYLCAEAGKDDEKSGEVLMISKEISNDMDKAKSISRDFNKKIWEKGLLRY